MEIDASWGELAFYTVALLAAGGIAGIMAGMFGIGGGAVLVPVLYQALEILDVHESVRMHIAVATSLGIIVPTSIRSYLAHKKRGAVDMALLKSWIIPVPVGVILGSLVAASISSVGLRIVFSVLAVLVALRLLFGRESWRLGNSIPGEPWRAGVGIVIGILSTLMGIGGGIFNNTFMVLFGATMLTAVATSSGLGVLISIPGLAGYVWAGWGNPDLPPFQLGFINWLGVLLLFPATVLAAPYGVRIAHALKRRHLEIAFGLFLIVIAARFILSLNE